MNERDTVHGPYETAAAALCDADHVYAAHRAAGRPPGRMDHINEGLILGTLRAAGVSLGDFDRLIAGWLADWEPATVQVVLGWIERASAGRNGGE